MSCLHMVQTLIAGLSSKKIRYYSIEYVKKSEIIILEKTSLTILFYISQRFKLFQGFFIQLGGLFALVTLTIFQILIDPDLY